jgi:hypothetical protein
MKPKKCQHRGCGKKAKPYLHPGNRPVVGWYCLKCLAWWQHVQKSVHAPAWSQPPLAQIRTVKKLRESELAEKAWRAAAALERRKEEQREAERQAERQKKERAAQRMWRVTPSWIGSEWLVFADSAADAKRKVRESLRANWKSSRFVGGKLEPCKLSARRVRFDGQGVSAF